MKITLLSAALVAIMVCCAHFLRRHCPERRYRLLMKFFLIPYVLLDLLLSVLLREADPELPIVWLPGSAIFRMLGLNILSFSDLWQLLKGEFPREAFDFFTIHTILQNILVYIPLGFLVREGFGRLRKGRILLAGLCLSLVMEMSQLIFRLGWFEVDDLLLNILGACLGGWISRKKEENMSEQVKR